VRYGVISDVHGNLHALRAVVHDLRAQGVDAWLSLGDLIGYGPQPNECVELVAELDAISVAGNHELIVLGEIEGASSSERAHRSHLWTRHVLGADSLAYLRRLPRRAEVDGIVLTHGSLDDPEEYVRTPARAAAQLEQLAVEQPEARLLLVGNTHVQQLHSESRGQLSLASGSPVQLDLGHRHLANPGSVGQSRQWEWPPRARCLVVDISRGQLTFRTVAYDVRGCRRELARQGLPYRSIHSTPAVGAALRRRGRRAWRRIHKNDGS
jgi:predicted phosphodiesterase